MPGEKRFTRIPPESTGDRIFMVHTAEILFDEQTDNSYTWKVGERYTISGNGGPTMSVHVHGVQDNGVDGFLSVHFSKYDKNNNIVPQLGQNIIDPDGTTQVAKVASTYDVYIPAQQIVGFDNPEYGVDVDPTGSMNVRFSEGLPQLDAFGKLRTSGATILGDYVFSDNDRPFDFAKTRNGAASVIWSEDKRCVTFSSGTTQATAITGYGAQECYLTSHTYHHYFPGFSHLAIMTAALDNIDVTGTVREWGYFDENNGYFFRKDEDSPLQLVIRSSATGVLTEIIIEKDETRYYSNGILQSTEITSWTGDHVDGTGDSRMNLRLIDDNIYWIDIQWLSAGRVRFGTYHRGQRVVIHEYYHEGSFNAGKPHSQTGALPIRFGQFNKVGESVSGTASLSVWCASVVSESQIDLKGIGRGQLESFEVQFDPTNLNDWQGLNDTGKGDRIPTTFASGFTTNGTAAVVPSTASLKAGYKLHLMDQDGGTGVITGQAIYISEIIDGTNIVLTEAPTTDFSGVENVMFHLHVNDEYQLLGILSPVKNIGTATHENRTLYLPQAMRSFAYHTDGTPATVEIEIYADPIVSGNSVAMPIKESVSASAPLTKIEPNDPYCAVTSYEDSGQVNYFGRGFHQLVSFVDGNTGREELGGQYTNFQAGAFKLKAANGGNNRCPLLKIHQSPAAGRATIIEINTPPTGVDYSLHREGNPIQFEGIPGAIGSDATYGLNINVDPNRYFYLRMISLDKAELYLDEQFQTPYDTSGLSTATNSGSYTWNATAVPLSDGGWIRSGYGPFLYFAIVAKPIGLSAQSAYHATHGDIVCHFALSWNEVAQ